MFRFFGLRAVIVDFTLADLVATATVGSYKKRLYSGMDADVEDIVNVSPNITFPREISPKMESITKTIDVERDLPNSHVAAASSSRNKLAHRLLQWVNEYYFGNRTASTAAAEDVNTTKCKRYKDAKVDETSYDNLTHNNGTTTSNISSNTNIDTAVNSNSSSTVTSFPLYFQHDGHSRTIIGKTIAITITINLVFFYYVK